MTDASLADAPDWASSLMTAPPALLALIGLAVTGLYCAFAVRRLQTEWEPPMGRAVSRPAGLSAATLRWMRMGRIDTASLMAAILALAHKGVLDVETKERHVRLRKRDHPAQPLSQAEHTFSIGLVRLASTILLNQNAVPMVKRGAAALQEGVKQEWRAYQRGRIGSLFRPAMAVAVIGLIAATWVSTTPVFLIVRAALIAGALVIAARTAGLMRDSMERLWWEPGFEIARTGFYAIATLAALGTGWMMLSFDGAGTDPDPVATLCCALALALPFLVKTWAIRSRHAAGPLHGRTDALRNQLLGRTQGIDTIAFSTSTPETADQPISNVTALVPADDPIGHWLPDAIALDAVPTPAAARVGGLSMAFEKPDRLAAVLRLAARAKTQGNGADAPANPASA